MPSKKQFIEIKAPRTEKLGRDSAVGGTVYADFVQDGERIILVKMPVKEVNVTKKKPATKSKPAQKAVAASAGTAKPTTIEKVPETAKDSPTSFDTSKMIEEVK